MTQPFWCVARTHPNCEKIAIQNLERQSYKYYQPKIKERKIFKQKITYAEQPLFPCYLFIQIETKWLSLQSTYGISSLIGGAAPSIVSDRIIEDLKSREKDGYIQLPKPNRLKIGDQVTIKSGVFAGQQALVQRMPARDRQKVLLALLANKLTCLIDERELEAA